MDEFVFRVGGPEDESSGNESSSDSDILKKITNYLP